MPIFVPAQPYPKKANDNIRSSDWNSAIDEVMRLSDATQYLNRNTFNGPLTVSGALTVSGGINGPLTISGALTVAGGLTVSGALTASSGINGPLTVKGALTVDTTLTVTGAVTARAALTVQGVLTASAGLTVTGNQTVSGLLAVSGYTRISQFAADWAVFGANMYGNGSAWKLVNTAQPGANIHMSAQSGGTSQFRFCLMDAGESNARNIATLGTGGLTVNDGINGPLTIRDSVTCTGSLLTVEGLAVVSTNIGAGRWASFGSNAYYRGSGWNLATTAQPGICLVMSATQSNNREFCFCRVEANATNSATDLATIGREGINLASGKKVAAGHERLYIIRGTVNANGTRAEGTGFSVAKQSGSGFYQINFDTAFSSTPTAVATQFMPTVGDTRDNAVIVALATNYIQVKVGSGTGALADRAFTFIAIGLRS